MLELFATSACLYRSRESWKPGQTLLRVSTCTEQVDWGIPAGPFLATQATPLKSPGAPALAQVNLSVSFQCSTRYDVTCRQTATWGKYYSPNVKHKMSRVQRGLFGANPTAISALRHDLSRLHQGDTWPKRKPGEQKRRVKEISKYPESNLTGKHPLSPNSSCCSHLVTDLLISRPWLRCSVLGVFVRP